MTLGQAQVSGATRANPWHVWLSGDAHGFARVREFVNIKSDPAVLGEGAHAALFLSGGARIGLGAADGMSIQLPHGISLGKTR